MKTAKKRTTKKRTAKKTAKTGSGARKPVKAEATGARLAKSKTPSKRRTKSTTRIVVFTCSWYPAIAADNAGVSGHEYPAGTRIVTLECAGRLTPSLILDAFGSGARGVMVGACKPELCHYVNGSSTCEQVVSETRELAELLGIGTERIHLETFDSEDGGRFADCVKGFWGRIDKLTPIELD